MENGADINYNYREPGLGVSVELLLEVGIPGPRNPFVHPHLGNGASCRTRTKMGSYQPLPPVTRPNLADRELQCLSC
jgi:hypothetical protein